LLFVYKKVDQREVVRRCKNVVEKGSCDDIDDVDDDGERERGQVVV
jgi:hypothetical protein